MCPLRPWTNPKSQNEEPPAFGRGLWVLVAGSLYFIAKRKVPFLRRRLIETNKIEFRLPFCIVFIIPRSRPSVNGICGKPRKDPLTLSSPASGIDKHLLALHRNLTTKYRTQPPQPVSELAGFGIQTCDILFIPSPSLGCLCLFHQKSTQEKVDPYLNSNY